MMQTQGVCPTCGGEGQIIKDKCPHCKGEGTSRAKVVEIKIPAGVAEGMVVNVLAKVTPDVMAALTATYRYSLRRKEHGTFVRDVNDLIYNLLLDFPTAALGGDLEIPTIEGGKLHVKIDNESTQAWQNNATTRQGTATVQGLRSGQRQLGGQHQCLRTEDTEPRREGSH